MMSKKILKAFGLAIAVAMLLVVIPKTQVEAGTLCVAPGGAGGCYASVNAAIGAAASGDTINIAAGTYTETPDVFRIQKNLTIVGSGKDTTIIKPDNNSAGVTWWWWFDTGTTCSISGVTLDGMGLYTGILSAYPGGVLTINDNFITGSTITGYGIYAYPGSTTFITNNSITSGGYDGIYVGGTDNITAYSTITGNTITGRGTGNVMEFGITVAGNGNATITGNTISNFRAVDDGSNPYIPNPDKSAAIIVSTIWYNPPVTATANITGNVLTDSTVGLLVGGVENTDRSMVTATGNIFARNEIQVEKNAVSTTTNFDVAAAFAGNTFDQKVMIQGGTIIYPSIQQAIDAAVDGDTILVGAGTYTENVLVNKQVSIIGAGSGTDGSIVTSPTTFDSKVGVFQISGSGTSTSPLLLQDMRVQPVGQAGISVGRFTEATGQNVSYLTLDNIYVYGSYYAPSTEQERGFYVDLTSTVDHLTVVDSVFTHLTYGWYLQKAVSADTSTVSNVSVTNTTFNYNAHKGIYAEKLTQAVFEDCTIDNNGSDDTVLPVYFNDWKAGVDINLKAGNYSNISFLDCTITNNGTGNAKEGVGITFKARTDGTTYGAFPATLSGVLVDGGTITGNERGIRIGEPGKNNAGPTNVLIKNVSLLGNVQMYSGTDGSAYGDMINMSLSQATASPVWWGSASGPATGQIYGDVLSCGWLDAAPPVGLPVAKPVINARTSEGYCTIQDAVDAAEPGDTINVAAGTYVEYVVINKNLSLIGTTGAIIQKPVGNVFYKLPDDGTTRTFRPVVLAYGGTITSGDGLTAATAYAIQGTDVVNVTIEGFHIDGGDAWADTTSSNWADGVLFRNVVGEISSNTIDGLVPAAPTSQNYSIGIEMRGDGNDIDVLDNIVSEFGRTGIYMAGNTGTPVAYIEGNTVTSTYYGHYLTNGIEIAYGSTGSITDNNVTGATGEGTVWTGTCIMLFGANNATVSGNSVSTCDVGISVGARINYNVTGLNNTISGNTIDNCTWSSIEVNTNVQNTQILNNVITNVAARSDTEEAGILVLEYSNPASGFPNGVLIEGNTISGDSGFWGIDIYRNANNVTIQKNTITGGEVAVALELLGTNSVGKTITISNAPGLGNKFIGQTGIQVSTGPYLYSDVTYQWTPDVPAAYNYWGSACGPTSVSGNVLYSPWYINETMTLLSNAPTTYHFAEGSTATVMNPVVACAPDGSTFIFDGNTSGGIVVPANKIGLTFELTGKTIGYGSPAFTIFGDDITIQGPGVLDGTGNSPQTSGIVVEGGADNFILDGVYIQSWQNGIEVNGAHTSFKVVSSWIHDNTAAGMLFNSDVSFTPSSVVTIEGNLFKANGGAGIENLSTTTTIPASYNSWGTINGPTGGVRSPDNAQRDISTIQTDDGTIWVFVSTGLGEGTERSIFYYTYDGSWHSPIAVPGTDYAAHISALYDSGKIWVFYDIGYDLFVVSYNESTESWSSPILIADNATLSKAMIDSGTFYVVWSFVNGVDIWGSGIYMSTSTNGVAWTSTSDPIAAWTGATNWDPVLIKEEGQFKLIWAPDVGSDGQFLASTTSSTPMIPSSWSTPIQVTTSSSGSNSWWDFWPEPHFEGNEYLFYASERDDTGTAMIDGNIWMKTSSVNVRLTSSSLYDRNPSILKAADNTYWLFFARGRDFRGTRGSEGYNPDLDYYDIYYKTANTVSGLETAVESLIPLTPTESDGVIGLVTTLPFSYSEIFIDMVPNTLATQVGITEQSTFSIAVKADAVNLYAVSFEIHYDPTLFDFISHTMGPNFVWMIDPNAICIPNFDEISGVLGFACTKTSGDEVTNLNGETIAIFEFQTKSAGLVGNGPWTTYFDLTTDTSDLSSGAIGGVKVFVNNGGFGSPSTKAGHTITDTPDDGMVIISAIGNFTGYIDLEGRPNDSGAVLSVYNGETKTSAIEVANGTSASSGKYTSANLGTNQLTVGSTYYLNVDAFLYLPTTVQTALVYEDQVGLTTRSLTPLTTVLLLGGDSTNDNDIDITDVSCIGGRYNQSPGTCGTNGSSDVNGDGFVDIYDLVLSGGNVYKHQSPWSPQ